MMARSLPIPSFTFIESRIHSLNKRLQEASAERSDLWWQRLADEFFEDSAWLAVMLPIDGLKSFKIRGSSIPKFFQSFYTGGATELYFIVRQTKEVYDRRISSMTVTSQCATMVTRYGDQASTSAFVEGNMTIQFSYDRSMKIKCWRFDVTSHKELMPKQIVTNPAHAEAITVCGIAREVVRHLERHGEIVTMSAYLLQLMNGSTSNSKQEQGSKRAVGSQTISHSTKRKRRSLVRKDGDVITHVGKPSCQNPQAVEAECLESSSTSSQTSCRSRGLSSLRQGLSLGPPTQSVHISSQPGPHARSIGKSVITGGPEGSSTSSQPTASSVLRRTCGMSPRRQGQMSAPPTPSSQILPQPFQSSRALVHSSPKPLQELLIAENLETASTSCTSPRQQDERSPLAIPFLEILPWPGPSIEAVFGPDLAASFTQIFVHSAETALTSSPQPGPSNLMLVQPGQALTSSPQPGPSDLMLVQPGQGLPAQVVNVENAESLSTSTPHTESPASYHSCATSPWQQGQTPTPPTSFLRISPLSGWSIQSTVQPIQEFPDQAVNDSQQQAQNKSSSSDDNFSLLS